MAFMAGFFSAWVRSDNQNDQSVMDGGFCQRLFIDEVTSR